VEEKMSDIKDQIFQKITSSMDIFKKIASKIPGFKGYVERQNRRDSDKLIRDTIYRRFRELEGRISDLQVEFINQGEIKHTNDLEKAALRLRTFADRVRTAPRGYSSLFEAVKINEAELAKLYEFDVTLLDPLARMVYLLRSGTYKRYPKNASKRMTGVRKWLLLSNPRDKKKIFK
jgi:hypothetical protein